MPSTDPAAGRAARLASRFQRPTAAADFLPLIDGWRFVAITSVVLYHLNDYLVTKTGRHGEFDFLSRVLSYGYLGVPLFFMLSGFIIARPFLAGRAPPIAAYFKRRLYRLEPPYLINLFLVYVLLVTVLKQDAIGLLPHLLASATYAHNLLFGDASKINFVAWSLEVEFQYYVLAPLILGLMLRFGTTSRRLALLGLIALGSWTFWDAGIARSVLGLTLVRYVGFFATGILAADVFVTSWRERAPTGWLGDLAATTGTLLLCGCAYVDGACNSLLPAAMLLMLLGSLRGTWTRRALSWRPVYLVGGMCYTIYLYHFYVISAVGRWMLPWMSADRALWQNLLILAAVVLPAVFVACAALFVGIERPFMQPSRPRRNVRAAVPLT